MTYVPVRLRRLVRDRAQERCEYCRLPDAVGFYPHEVDHLIAKKHDGQTVDSNLCLSCWICNRHKGSDLASIDPHMGTIRPLFHPRRDRREDHFLLVGAAIEGSTPQGTSPHPALGISKRSGRHSHYRRRRTGG